MIALAYLERFNKEASQYTSAVAGVESRATASTNPLFLLLFLLLLVEC